MVKQIPEIEAWIVGDGSGRANVEETISTSGADPRCIRLLVRIEVSKIYSALRKYHAFTLLSDHEGLPISMREAMAAGIIPVCLDMSSGILRAIQPGINGQIVKRQERGFFRRSSIFARGYGFLVKIVGQCAGDGDKQVFRRGLFCRVDRFAWFFYPNPQW